MNLTVHGLEGNIQEGNTFYEDKQDMVGKADFVMANPPFNVDGVDKAKDAATDKAKEITADASAEKSEPAAETAIEASKGD